MRKLITGSLLLIAALFIWQRSASIHHAPGTLTPEEPEQVLFETPQPVIEKNGWTLKPLASYHIEARVLSVCHYSTSKAADLSPCDLALGWGAMSDTAVLDRLDITQGGRFYHWRYWGEKPPIPEREIITHSANVHIIPADDQVLGDLKSLRKGSLISMTGYLVEATHPLASHSWRSSLTRDDTGAGACELMYVTALSER